MGERTPPHTPSTENFQEETSILADLTSRISQMLNQTPTPTIHEPLIGIKLDGTNYGLWSQVVEMYISGKDKLKQRVGSIETYYNTLQGFWREIDFRRPNPMKCETDIQKYNSMLQEDRVYIFLDGLDDRLDKVRADVLQLQPFPTVEQAYAHVRREDFRQTVMLTKEDTISSAADFKGRT
ncbi:hypothetical protein BUALT_Bualt03G0158100 [Buddleja alternifolia]|uniref:Retrotransposon Copia-like N-terminal domain-containing protein n=1 Tax=Buddleja alternifolia TaxID=168488 RepID=A0AAV6XU35_9LAMI|nr:hypothetical protein BUALT_Bualt03G0158100 [Buddleja alternifolia]